MSDESSAAPAANEQPSAAPAATVQSVESPAPQGSLQGPDGAAPGTPEAATTGEDGTAAQEPAGSKNKVPYKERIEQLVAQRNEAFAERDAVLQRLQALEQVRQSAQQPQVQPLDPLNFQSDAEYQAAFARQQQDLLNAAAQRAAGAVRQELLNEQQAQAEQRAMQLREATWTQRVQEFKERAPDFEKVALDDSVPCSQAMAALIKESDHGPEVAYWLGSNRDVAARIASLHPVQAALEIGRIEARVSAPTAPRFTQAPPPVKTVGNSGAPARDIHVVGNTGSYKDYEAARLAQINGK